MYRFYLVIAACTISLYVSGQQPRVYAGFVEDSIKIGSPVHFYLAARYPEKFQVLFPDSTYSFEPFEYTTRKYFPTKTTQGESYDSAVYELLTFDITEVQYLSLPVFIVQERDCTRVNSARDSIALQLLVRVPLPDTVTAQNLPLITRTYYERVRQLFNYPVLILITVVLLVAGGVGWLVFGKRIRKYLAIRKVKSRHRNFDQQFSEAVASLVKNYSPKQTETALVLWKQYLEFLEEKPYTKLTTRETLQLEKDPVLGQSLKILDRAVYGHETDIHQPLKHLGELARERTQKKIETISYG
jgi:hypothetical protein